MLPAVVLVRDQVSVAAGCCPHLPQMGRSIGVPTLLVPTHELHPHRCGSQLREQGGGLGHVVIAAVTVGAGAVAVLHAHLFNGQAQ